MLCSCNCMVSGYKLVPGTWVYQTSIQHQLRSLGPAPHQMWKSSKVVCNRHVLDFPFLLTNKKICWHMYSFIYVFTATEYSWNRTFSNWGRKGNKTMPAFCTRKTNEQLRKHTKIWVLGLAFHGSENEWNFNWIQTFPCVHVDSIYYCSCKGQADASMLFNKIN